MEAKKSILIKRIGTITTGGLGAAKAAAAGWIANSATELELDLWITFSSQDFEDAVKSKAPNVPTHDRVATVRKHFTFSQIVNEHYNFIVPMEQLTLPKLLSVAKIGGCKLVQSFFRAGKTSHMALLATKLKDEGYEVLSLRFKLYGESSLIGQLKDAAKLNNIQEFDETDYMKVIPKIADAVQPKRLIILWDEFQVVTDFEATRREYILGELKDMVVDTQKVLSCLGFGTFTSSFLADIPQKGKGSLSPFHMDNTVVMERPTEEQLRNVWKEWELYTGRSINEKIIDSIVDLCLNEPEAEVSQNEESKLEKGLEEHNVRRGHLGIFGIISEYISRDEEVMESFEQWPRILPFILNTMASSPSFSVMAKTVGEIDYKSKETLRMLIFSNASSITLDNKDNRYKSFIRLASSGIFSVSFKKSAYGCFSFSSKIIRQFIIATCFQSMGRRLDTKLIKWETIPELFQSILDQMEVKLLREQVALNIDGFPTEITWQSQAYAQLLHSLGGVYQVFMEARTKNGTRQAADIYVYNGIKLIIEFKSNINFYTYLAGHYNFEELRVALLQTARYACSLGLNKCIL